MINKFKTIVGSIFGGFKGKQRKEEIKLLNLSYGAFLYYKNNVRGCKGISYDLAKRKLTRNVLLAYKVKNYDQETKANKTLYLYGQLLILVVDNTVVWIKNRVGSKFKFHKDFARYYQLNEIFGINDYKVVSNTEKSKLAFN